MAKVQSFADKAKKQKQTGVNVKVVRMVKGNKGAFKFNEKFVKLDNIVDVTNIK
ncbi:MAG: hypothetical protein HYV28_14610 [Ignavibacteriales bacterium]|nr:hypothetical protein [Ignavibacteriales bacterium]MBI5727679.1 hypothetical protein [Ignavibacteriales bacterium]